MKLLPLVILLVILSGSMGIPHADAIILTVNSPTDEVDNEIGNCICLTASQTCTLRAAIQEANACQGDDIINLPPDTYTLTIPGANEDLSATGDLDITSNVTISGENALTTIIDGNELDRIFDIIGASTTVHLHYMTVRKGRTLSANGLERSNGGGIANAGVLTINHSSITNNNLTTTTWYGYGCGGGIGNSGTLFIYNTVVSENSGNVHGMVYGGGICNSGQNASLLLENVTIAKNTSGGNYGGAGLANFGQVSILNSTFSDNIDEGGRSNNIYNNIYNDPGPSITIKNTAISNTATGTSCLGTITSQGYNLDSENSCQFTDTSDLINTDPKLGQLQNNGGNTLTYALLPGSPAIDHGDPTGCPATDQRGVFRPKGAACDIGAFEFVPQLFLPLILKAS